MRACIDRSLQKAVATSCHHTVMERESRPRSDMSLPTFPGEHAGTIETISIAHVLYIHTYRSTTDHLTIIDVFFLHHHPPRTQPHQHTGPSDHLKTTTCLSRSSLISPADEHRTLLPTYASFQQRNEADHKKPVEASSKWKSRAI